MSNQLQYSRQFVATKMERAYHIKSIFRSEDSSGKFYYISVILIQLQRLL